MMPENRIRTHPGVVLSEEFLKPRGVTQVALAAHDLARSRPARSVERLAVLGE